MTDRFHIGRALRCPLSGQQPIDDSVLSEPCLRAVTGKYLRLCLSLFRKTLPQNLSDTGMQLLLSAAEQSGVCGILDEGVLENVSGLRGDATPED